MKMHPATHEQIVDAVARAGAFARRKDAERVTRVVVAALRERLGDAEAEALARDLPPELADVVRRGKYRAELAPDDLYGVVHEHARAARSLALEQAQIVLRVLGDAMSDATRALFERELPAEWSELFFGERELGEPPPYAAPRAGERVRSKLSTAHPGYPHPIAEASAPPAHAGSVAREDGARDDRKMSTGHPHTNRS